ncbi:nitrilase-related carbon-nitrogen hydrolase [Actinomadura sp. WMMB 499]|uniref:nitrilase-related carbon-nitrogen hydrolase n=1 Tax=Actinomadura sp. WMMB 499 TaxID=1219491 RepID=UPI0012466DA3|nr:nitrilase-related carbon-nitrogen hydrolase [Actinomadura sp. WMMB 499]QFG23579.1 hydrolase [Actinomadura sp. WMMB 499]
MVTRIVCAQVAPVVGDPAGNRARSVAAVRDAAARGAHVIVLPELVTSGYVFASAAEAADAAVTPADPVFAAWADAAGGPASGRVVVGGFCERGPDGRLYNSAAVVDRGAVAAVYRKTHLWDAEKTVFTPGDRPAPVVATTAGPIGVLICYDLEFPEMPRALARGGARLVAAPVNWPLVDRPAGERPPEAVLAMAAARASRMFVACCDRTGDERGVRWTGGTVIVGADGWPLAEAGTRSGVAVADVDLADAADKTASPRNDLLRDRRPELY